ncbi:23S rRNA (guanosine(2251)-2'-O)-methyltransferase RlmB [bacterium]|nr:23S rRNA (guanosine(2251)-2'-O)-methyltransferase RlmB [bacterium]
MELLRTLDRQINKILLLKTGHGDKRIDNIIQLARDNSIPFSFVPKEQFKKFQEYSHQGVIAFVSPVKYIELEDFLEKTKNKQYKKIIVLDEVEDPHNVGSIIRTAVCAGYDAVILPKRRCSMINATVEKSSAGAINHIDIVAVNSIQNAIVTLKDNDFWIIASVIDAKDNYFDIDYTDMNFAIILGNEKSGISRTIVKNSDFWVKIPIETDFDSLNVANAASVIIYESVKQKIIKDKKFYDN